MRAYSKFVSGKRFGEELILEKMKNSSDFSNFINVNHSFLKLNSN